MSEIPSLRAEIKQWERDFRAQEGKEPDINDIKSRPKIAQKYKLYKKLSKAAANQESISAQSSAPSTPPRKTNRVLPVASLSAKRVVAPTGPLSTFNPFSPRKSKGKDSFSSVQRTPKPIVNPFASPVKSSKERIEQPSFQAISTNGIQDRSLPASPPEPPNTISRARKRLRGEPVSPSPNKGKRRRRSSPETTLTALPLSFNVRQDDGDDEDYSDTLVGNLSFVDDSPMKTATSARSFTSLFEENHMPSSDIFGLNKKASTGTSHSQKTSKPGSSSQDVNVTTKPSNTKGKIFPKPPRQQQTLTQFLVGAPRKGTATSSITTSQSSNEDGPRSPTSSSTALPQEDVESRSPKQRSKSPLLPPSPPPARASAAYKKNGKRKANAKSTRGRKKAKMTPTTQSDEDTTSDSEFTSTVKIISRPRRNGNGFNDEGSSDLDPTMTYPWHAKRQSAPSPPLTEGDHASAMIDLPDKLRNVLALDASDITATDREAEKVFQTLVYRRRVTPYDPKKGEIWDVGEETGNNDGEGEPTGEDDEWEGEPVPWGVAEL